MERSGRFDNRTVLVTGAARGIGLAYAQRFLDEGARVVMADVDEETGKAAAEACGGGDRAHFVEVDISDVASVDACIRASADRYDGIDVLVNNAALYGGWDMNDQSYEYLRRVFEINLHGMWLMTRAVAPLMAERRYGRIVNQSSGAAYNYRSAMPTDRFPGLGAYSYSQTKWGVVGLTKFTAGQLGAWGITVNCIAPGVIGTEATTKAIPANLLDAVIGQQAIAGLLQPADLTGAVAFLASEEARFVTGQVLVVDGGKHMPA